MQSQTISSVDIKEGGVFTRCRCVNVLGPALPEFVRQANKSFWSEYYESMESPDKSFIQTENAVIKLMFNLVAKKTHHIKDGKLFAYYDGNLVKGKLCDECSLSKRYPQSLRRATVENDQIHVELERDLYASDVHPSQLLHQSYGHAQWRLYKYGDMPCTGVMEQIRDIIAGQPSYYVYASGNKVITQR